MEAKAPGGSAKAGWRQQEYRAAGRLVPVLGASCGADAVGLALRLGRFAASLGETVLILDGREGELVNRAGIVCARTLEQAVRGDCDLGDCTFVTANEHFSISALGRLPLGDAVGTFAALSLFHDWVFVVPPEGLAPSSARLAAGSDAAVIAFEAGKDRFMRAYWMIDAVRARNPRFDPYTVAFGPVNAAAQSATRLETLVRAHLGAAPHYAGHESARDHVETLLGTLRESCARKAA